MFTSVKGVLMQYLYIGTHENKSRDANQQLFVSNLFSFIGYSITFILAVSAAVKGETVLSGFLLLASTIFFFCHHVHRFPKLGDTIAISTRLVLFCLLALMVYLVHSGGLSNTGPLWIYIVPPVAFFFGGLRKGLMNLGGFILIISIMLFYPHDSLLAASYSFEFKTRLMYSFLTVTLLFGFYEYSRQKSYEFIEELGQKYEQQAMQDPLTQLPNRRGMRMHLDQEYSRALRSNQALSILAVDVDHFKKVNDEYLHDGGDFVLESLSTLFAQLIRKQDIVARWGGEEFLFLLPNTNAQDAYILAEKIRTHIENHVIQYKQHSIKITLSIGVNAISHDGNIDHAINVADHLMYEAKKRGRNCTMMCESEHNSTVKE
jgi:diguanylate cyclase (GGDEF)-like protein